mmetsp:Transcript_27955/g.69795  ORF Transcript_27955/g.69795 Transcript_27955/m.69795 type:complete len:247 (+) Transcript_27955:2453-3193(+)
MPQSNVLLRRMELTASGMSAVSSMTAGVLPAPPPIAGLPDEYAALTNPPAPVATTMEALLCCMSVLHISTVGMSIQPMQFSGAPASTAASLTIFAVAMVHRAVRGCGEKTMQLRVLSARSDLKMVVDVGLVQGTMPASTPMGSATTSKPPASSRSTTPQVLVSLYLLWTYSEAKWFLMVLSSRMPMPPSSTAILASGTRCWAAAVAARWKILSTCSWFNKRILSCATYTSSMRRSRSAGVLTTPTL